MMSKPTKSGISLQLYRISQSGRHLWKSFTPTPLLKQGHLEQVLDHVTGYLHGFIRSFDVLSMWSDQNNLTMVLHHSFYFCQEHFSKILVGNFLQLPAVTNSLISVQFSELLAIPSITSFILFPS